MIDATILKSWMLENNGNILYDPMHEGVFVGYVTFTPERSASALENNTRNRKLNIKTQLPVIMEAMKNNEWDENVSLISFNKYNELSDGQHRLESGVKQNKSFRNLVVYGVSERAQHYTDRRGNRMLSDDFQIDGLKCSAHLSAVTRVVYKSRVCGTGPKALINRNNSITAVPDATLYDFFYENQKELERLERLINNAYNSVSTLGIPQSIMNVLVYEFDQINSEDAKCFWKKLSDGYTTLENDPVMLLRNRLAKNKDKKTDKLPNIIMGALIIKTWNYYMKGETIDCLKFTSGGAHPEEFPEIYNPYEGE